MRWLFRLHKGLGWVLGLPFALLAVTGALLAFADEMDRALNPDLRNIPPEFHAQMQPLNTFLEKSADLPLAIYPPMTPYDSLRIDWLQQKGDKFNPVQTYYNPYTGKVLGSRPATQTLPYQLAQLHHTFWAGQPGFILVQFALIAGGAILITGLVNALKQKKRSLHARTGLWISGILFLITGSAFISLYSPWRFADLQRPDYLQAAYSTREAARLQQAYQTVKPTLTQAAALCKPPLKPKAIMLSYQGWHVYCQGTLDSDVLSQQHWLLTNEGARPQPVANWLWALHSGSWLNLPGRMLWMWVSLAVLFLLYTGYKKQLRRLK